MRQDDVLKNPTTSTEVVGGALAPLDVIDFTFGARRVTTPEELASSIRARGAPAADRTCEPGMFDPASAITELRAPSCSAISIVPDDDSVRDGWTEMKAVALEMHTARETGAFPATPGRHRGWCGYRDRCPLV